MEKVNKQTSKQTKMRGNKNYITQNIIIIQFNSIQFFVYLRAELNSRWPITESAQNIIKN
jgi:hypothetical protein